MERVIPDPTAIISSSSKEKKTSEILQGVVASMAPRWLGWKGFFFGFFLTLPVWGVGWADGEWKSKEERKKKERYFFKKTSKDPVCPLRSSRIGLGRVPDVRLSRCGWSRGVAVLIKRSTLSLSLSLSLFRSSPIYLSLSYLRLLMRRSIRQ